MVRSFNRDSKHVQGLRYVNRRLLFCQLLLSVNIIKAFTFNVQNYKFTSIKISSTGKEASSSGFLENVFSGLTGKPPSSLPPPPDILSGTNIDPNKSNVELTRVYKASEDGWSAVDFHRCVDGRGSAFVSALSRSGKRFGGFNPLGWMSTDDYGTSNSAFLWFDRNGKGIRVPVLQGGNAAVFDYATGGPCFGAADLQIGPPKAPVMGGFAGPDMQNTAINAGDLRKCSSVVGGAYDFVKGWPVAGDFQIVELEVYCNGNIVPRGESTGGFKFWNF